MSTPHASDSPHALPPELPTNRVSHALDTAIAVLGKGLSWLWLATLAVVLANVFSRFILGRGSIALEELSWHFFGATMILTLAYAVVTDDHVRVDVLRERFSLRFQAWVELLGIVVLVLPVLAFMVDGLAEYAYRSFERGEHSQAPSGLPYRFIIKSTLPLGMALIALALSSRALRCCTYLFDFPRKLPLRRPADHR
ncbi:TRAP transporter small permease subunit [Halomonas sp. MCCC 1A17488]|uniref:TRAP transporter small permease protein n=1 Tax=Billgrantia sulfidoxydans TaxID=2733484 RepID=A0ABX7W973_9GAMM|nr:MULTISPECIES: TRAP transporter small permease subunit [Halomonas]MCE8018349.1 TRAP transporter small permease subunit [Halomonas sp. MCCC 1A17488]MCG3241682.1 TRAP transporter small permease subunit [Halomonas sp. MCCC 1A17488]QPP49287.1 TRAP transporter small permease subunit [Halomonas sp. SS10-MC5]QTP56645.1 TRAP transporter small permease subunit [Halomonas sulfidoxydans]